MRATGAAFIPAGRREVRDATVAWRAEEARTPVQWLPARGLLLPAGQHNVVLPRSACGPAVRTATAAGQAFTAVRTVADLLKEWQTGGPAAQGGRGAG